MNRYGKSGQPFLIPDFREIALSFSPFSLMLSVDFVHIAFIMFRCVPCIPAFQDLSHEGVLYFVKSFFSI